MGQPEDPVAGRLKGGVATTVVLESGAVGVIGEAVQLDDEAGVGPVGVDFRAEHGNVGKRRREVVLATKVSELVFQRRAGFGHPLCAMEEALDLAQAAPAVASLADCLQFGQVKQVEAVGFFEGTSEAAVVDDFGEVEESARDRGDRDGGVVGVVVEV